MTAELETTADVTAVAALGEEVRWRLYNYIRLERRPVGREEAASAAGISRKLAAFHLDKLADVGLLRPSFDTTSRAVGRRPKMYEPSVEDIRLSIPARRHQFLAEILVHALVSGQEQETARTTALRAARERGVAVGKAERDRLALADLTPAETLSIVEKVLDIFGFEPGRVKPACIRLRNCPFHPIAAAEPELVCGLNHAFLGGVLEGLGTRGIEAALAPAAGECCVELHTAGAGRTEVSTISLANSTATPAADAATQ